MSAPVFFSDVGKFLLDYSGASAFDVLNYFADGVVRRDGNENVDVIGGNIAADDVHSEFFTGLADDISDSDG